MDIAIGDIIERLKNAYNLKTDAKLAEFLGIKSNNVAMWKTRNTLDYQLIITKCNDIDLNWLFTGKEAPKSESTDIEDPRIQQSLNVIETYSNCGNKVEKEVKLCPVCKEVLTKK